MNFNIALLKKILPLGLGVFAVCGCIFLLIYYGSAFFFAIPLWFKDIYKKIKNKLNGEESVFDMYGVYLFNGLGGNGKTISMVRKAEQLKEQFPKLMVIANFHTDVADRMFDKWEDILYTENIDKNGVNQGVLILFDEMHLTLNSQSWQSAPDELLEYISLQRHLHKCIFGSAQEWTRVSKIVREQVNFIVDCKSLFGGRYIQNKIYTKENFLINGEQKNSGMRKRPVEEKYSFVGTDELRSKYDTHEIVKGLKIGAVDSQTKMANRLLQALADAAEAERTL